MMSKLTHHMLAVVALVLSVSLSGCDGTGTANSGHAIGYIYADAADATSQMAGRMYLLAAPSGDRALRPVAGVNLTLEEADRTTRTAADGRYAFYDVRAGRYTLQATHQSYPPRQWEIVVQAGYTSFGDAVMRRTDPPQIDDDRSWRWDSDDRWTPAPQPSTPPTPHSPPPPTPPPTDDTADDGGGISVFRTDR